MRRVAPRGWEPIVSVYRDFWRVVASSVRPTAGARLALLALVRRGARRRRRSSSGARPERPRHPLHAAPAGPRRGARRRRRNREDVARIDQQIAQADRVFQGTRAAMEDAGCFESFFIFGRGLVRSPKCLNMNDRVEDARRQLTQLQQQRQALTGGGGNRRRQAELQDALARSGCGGQPPAQKRRGGGLFDFFGGGQEEQEEPFSRRRSIAASIPNGRYRSVCVRLCDGFFYPIHYSTYGSLLGQDAAIVPVELRGAGRALCLSEPGPGDRAGRVAERLGLYGPPRRAAFQARNMSRGAPASRPNTIRPRSRPPISAPRPTPRHR